ncbi:hypothetical protein UFOVP1244_34 [uncultured Caudovirales phage]|uniref:Uncharacterized protein n=1 Tax=uncultured Caudovirales phage TaxID=2100421 RepID=A0A6J5R6I2_9CAUD|nr:hypothetical protein UFOVP1244_34 [uncultured Caudovirales phage]
MSHERITPEYLELNKKMHDERVDYGHIGARHAESIIGVAKVYECQSLLDYGCGKQTLIEALRVPWARGYDPCIPGLDAEPKPAELVVCTDTLEHIEPHCLEAVLDHIKSLTLRLFFVSICVLPSKKTLADGRNTHLIVQPAAWWLWRLLPRWELDTARSTERELTAVMRVPGERSRDPVTINNIRK